jgi:hypothetical protein
VKTCSYCGRANANEEHFCGGCGTKLEAGEGQPISETPAPTVSKSPEAAPRPSNLLSAGFFEGAEPLDLSLIEMGFEFVEGFSRPDWKLVRHSIQNHFPEEKWPQAWREAGIKWVTQLRDDLGGDYRHYESWSFLLLSAETEENSQAMLRMAENTVDSLAAILGSVGSGKPLMGKRMLLVFGEDDDYYSYISFYYGDGDHRQTRGVFIRKDYAHVAIQFAGLAGANRVITHEVTHNYMWGLRIPTWLNEGLSQRMEREIRPDGRRSQSIMLSRELAEEHRAYWNEQNIQEFWAGLSFHMPGEVSKLSYSLGLILLEVLSENWGNFLDFLQNADARDAGQDAALKCLGRSLGDAASGLLGPGNWRPNRKAIADIWEMRKKQKSNDKSD